MTQTHLGSSGLKNFINVYLLHDIVYELSLMKYEKIVICLCSGTPPREMKFPPKFEAKPIKMKKKTLNFL